ncbi:MAG TPA: hypothetical protein PLC07_06210 [Bacillota bacterium]|nr:hypothetical protein [Bacillota bacterium]
MGYHIIIKSNECINRYYIENLDQLYDIEGIDKNSIIYQAEETWKPYLISEVDQYQKYIDRSFRIGVKAEKLFEKYADESNLILEKIDQSKKSLVKYIKQSNGKPVKRGDFLVRGYEVEKLVEIEVKARKFIIDKDIGLCFGLDYTEFKRLENMMNTTKNLIVFSVYQVINDEILSEVPYFISLHEIKILNKENELKYISDGKFILIPIKHCSLGIDGINKYIKN